MSFNNVYVRTVQPGELMTHGASAKAWDEVDFSIDGRSNRKGEISWTISDPSKVYGFAYWWVARLTGDIVLSTAPGAPSTHWEQLYFPLSDPIEAKKGDGVTLSLRSKSSEEAGTHLAWTAIHSNAKGVALRRQAHDLDKGFLP